MPRLVAVRAGKVLVISQSPKAFTVPGPVLQQEMQKSLVLFKILHR